MKKRGKTIKNRLALKPLGFKNTKYELSARAALLAIKHNAFNQQHLVDLYVLADICERLSDERYIRVHSSSVKALVEKAAPIGETQFECPACHAMKGLWKFPFAPSEGKMVRQCNCGNQLFYLTPEGHMCANCGIYQQY